MCACVNACVRGIVLTCPPNREHPRSTAKVVIAEWFLSTVFRFDGSAASEAEICDLADHARCNKHLTTSHSTVGLEFHVSMHRKVLARILVGQRPTLCAMNIYAYGARILFEFPPYILEHICKRANRESTRTFAYISSSQITVNEVRVCEVFHATSHVKTKS